jgi:hypothetical protein
VAKKRQSHLRPLVRAGFSRDMVERRDALLPGHW